MKFPDQIPRPELGGEISPTKSLLMRNCTPDQMRRPEHFPTWSWDPPCRKTWENRSSRDLIPRWNLEPKQSHFTAFMGAEQLQEHWRACRLASCPPPSSNCFQPFRASHQPHLHGASWGASSWRGPESGPFCFWGRRTNIGCSQPTR